MDAYSEAHLFVAAIRVMQHQKGNIPPSLEDVCAMMGSSVENGHRLCRDLKKLNIVDTIEDAFSVKLQIVDHLELEKIPRQQAEANNLAKELEKFQAEKRGRERKASEIQAEIERKKRDMLADIEAKFKKEMEKHKKG